MSKLLQNAKARQRPSCDNLRTVRIAIVTDTYRPDINGVAMTLGRFVEELRKRKHLVYVSHTGDTKGKGESLMKSVPLPGYREVRVGLPGKGKLSRRWIKKQPDVVYVATESPLGISAIKAANKLGIPVVAGFHTNFHHYMQDYRMGRMRHSAMAYLRRVHALADCTVVPSTDVRSMLAGEGFTDVRVIGRGVDTGLFCPSKRCAELRQSWGARPGTKVVMVVGRVAAEKNLSLAMRAFNEMQTRVPDLLCVVVGDGPLRETLSHQYRNVQFAGLRTGDDLARHYASADIILFPSESETFGNVLLEGMASGAAVVAYDYAAARQHVINGKNGLLAPKGDEQVFIEKAIEAIHLKGDDMAQAATATTRQLSWEAMAIQLESCFSDLASRAQPNARKFKGKKQLKVRTLFLSDIHLGTDDSKSREVINVLKRVSCKRIVLNGDIIDGWALRRGKKWRSIHTRVIRELLKKMEKEKTEIIYLRGNHDDFMEKFLPVSLGKLRCVKEFIHHSAAGKKYLVLHGDGFDSVSTGHRWVAKLGAVSYDFLLGVNRIYNRYRLMRGKDYYSVSKAIKAKVKSTVNFVSNYEKKLVGLARKRGCEGIICGHIHTPADESKDGIHYLNSGDWVETMSCIVEENTGGFSVLYYEDIIERTMDRPLQSNGCVGPLASRHPVRTDAEALVS